MKSIPSMGYVGLLLSIMFYIMNSMQEMADEKSADRITTGSVAAELEQLERELDHLKIRIRATREKL